MGVAHGLGVCGLACAPAISTSDTMAVPEPEMVVNPSSTRAHRVDVGEGFVPPSSLTRDAERLEVDWKVLVDPASVPAAKRQPLAEAWPEAVELQPPDAGQPRLDPLPCRSQHYLAHDPRPLRTVEFEHDAEGRVVRERIDNDTDGTVDLDLRYRWAADGRLESQQEGHGSEPSCAGPLPGWRLDMDHRYDGHGVWLGQEVLFNGELDDTPKWRRTDYDRAGRPIRWLHFQGGTVLGGATVEWDAQGRRVEEVVYEGDEPLRVDRWSYPSASERYQASWELGQWKVRREQLDADGHVVIIQMDEDFDGVVERRDVLRYDAEGREIERLVDADADGESETTIATRWGEGDHRLEELTEGPEGTRRQRWRWDDAGRLLRWSSKYDEGWAEDFEEHRYDEAGRELERESEVHVAVTSVSDIGGYSTREHWVGEYDEQGRLVRATVLAGDLGPNERIEYIYECSAPYRRHPRRNPLDHPETASECFGGFE